MHTQTSLWVIIKMTFSWKQADALQQVRYSGEVTTPVKWNLDSEGNKMDIDGWQEGVAGRQINRQVDALTLGHR